MRAVPESGRRNGYNRYAVRFSVLNHLVIVRPGLLAQLGLFTVVSSAAMTVTRILAGGPILLPTWADSSLCGVLLLATILFHEMGHLLANAILGRKHHCLNLGWRFFVLASTCSNRQQVIVSAAGPLLELAAGYLLWTVGGNGLAALCTPLGMAGALACLNGIVQLLPLGPRYGDGRKLWSAAFRSVRPKTLIS